MKSTLAMLLCIFGMIACRKSNASLVAGSGSRLTGIFVDSPGIILNLGYTGDQITSMGRNYATNIEYTDTNATQYVILHFYPDSLDYSITYALTTSKLPLRIDEHSFYGGSTYANNIAKFVYSQSTDLLDSVIAFPDKPYYGPLIFKFTYTGQNITQVTESQISNSIRYSIDTFNFTYSNTPNVFRYTNSLLYIYTDPISVFHAQPPFVASFFAETFSASTFNSMTISNAGFAWAGYTGTYTMNFTLNAEGRITEESFLTGSQASFADKKYYYQ
jgi:hypothetical protein